MKVRGEVFSGVMHGESLIEKYYPRLIGLLGFKPVKGTMDIKLERHVDIKPFATKTIEHILTNGLKKVDACMAPVKIRKISTIYSLMEIRDEEQDILKKLGKLRKDAKEHFPIKEETEIEPAYECWAIRFKDEIHSHNMVELIAPEIIKERLGLQDGDKVELEFTEHETKKRARPLAIRTVLQHP